jgi:single-strand DNA-binding protein
MAKGVNKVILLGRVGQDPEVRQAGTTNVVQFSLATSESWNDKSGQKQERTEWHRCKAFGKLADICAQYVHKGDQIYVEGKLQTSEWTDQQGQKRYATDILFNEMQMLSPKNSTGGTAQAPVQTPAQRPAAPVQNGQPTDFDDDIPF